VEVTAQVLVRAQRHARDPDELVRPCGRDILRHAQLTPVIGDEFGRVCTDDDPIAQCASEIIDRALDLSASLRRYRRAVANASTLRDDDFPF
jgi:hypothetical protein